MRVLCASVCAGVAVYLAVFVELQQRRSVSRWRWLDDFWLLGPQWPLLAHAIATSNRQTENLTRSRLLPHTLSLSLSHFPSPSFLLCHIQIVIVTRVCPCRQLTTHGITVNSWLDNCNATDAAAIVRRLFSDRCDLHKLCERGRGRGAIMRYIYFHVEGKLLLIGSRIGWHRFVWLSRPDAECQTEINHAAQVKLAAARLADGL